MNRTFKGNKRQQCSDVLSIGGNAKQVKLFTTGRTGFQNCRFISIGCAKAAELLKRTLELSSVLEAPPVPSTETPTPLIMDGYFCTYEKSIECWNTYTY